MIYFDNAATSLWKPPEVEEAVIRALKTAGNAGRGAHEPTLLASRIVYDARAKLAELFGVGNPSRIAFTCNATEALNTAISGILRPGDHVITSVCEHNSVLRPLYRMEKQGVELSFLEADEKGRIRYEMLEPLLQKNTRAVVITHVSNLTGNVTDLERVAVFTKAHGLWLVVDASQSAGVLPIRAEQAGIDVLCFTGHKGLLGPQGTGGLYVREGINAAPWKVGGSGIQSYSREHPADMPAALEAGTLNVHGIAGLGASAAYLLRIGTDNVWKQEKELAYRFAKGVRELPGVTVYGDWSGENRVGIVSFNLEGEDSGRISDLLWEDYGICVRAGAHCAPLMHRALGTEKQGAVRFSFSHKNTVEEVDFAVRAVRELALG
ncbi:MAG: aminotransferase class V-fold PLP-dependent enzyme [Eubacteriales bacterium]|nr:aminotransferase class V-fold PLP-dependent enzyme [Eubacteriales bacterium]